MPDTIGYELWEASTAMHDLALALLDMLPKRLRKWLLSISGDITVF